MNPVRILNIVTSALSVRFLEGQTAYFERRGYEVVVVSSPGAELTKTQRNGVQTIAVPMVREISVLKDSYSVWRLFHVILRLRPTITNVGTPKAG